MLCERYRGNPRLPTHEELKAIPCRRALYVSIYLKPIRWFAHPLGLFRIWVGKMRLHQSKKKKEFFFYMYHSSRKNEFLLPLLLQDFCHKIISMIKKKSPTKIKHELVLHNFTFYMLFNILY